MKKLIKEVVSKLVEKFGTEKAMAIAVVAITPAEPNKKVPTAAAKGPRGTLAQELGVDLPQSSLNNILISPK